MQQTQSELHLSQQRTGLEKASVLSSNVLASVAASVPPVHDPAGNHEPKLGAQHFEVPNTE